MNKREEILTLANKAVNGEREQTYGSPERSFQRIAQFWTAYLHRDHIPLNELDVAKMMILFKLARTQEEKEHLDNWVDIAGYAACAGEIEHNHFHPDEVVVKAIAEEIKEETKRANEEYEKFRRRVREAQF